jgi:hypothetical protein
MWLVSVKSRWFVWQSKQVVSNYSDGSVSQLAPSQSILVIHDHDLGLPLHTMARPRRLPRPTLCTSRRSYSPRRWRFLSKCRADGLEISVVHHCSCSAVKLLHLVIFFLGLPALHIAITESPIAITEFFFVEELTSTHMNNCELYKLLWYDNSYDMYYYKVWNFWK